MTSYDESALAVETQFEHIILEEGYVKNLNCRGKRSTSPTYFFNGSSRTGAAESRIVKSSFAR